MRSFLLRLSAFLALQALVLALLCDPSMPRETNYLARTIEKHHLLRSQASPRLVLVGGSNVAFGFVTEELEQNLHLPVVNMGLAAGLGFPLMLAEVRDQIRSGDVVLLSPEYDFAHGGRHPRIFGQMLELRPASVVYVPFHDWKKEIGDTGLGWIGGFLRRSLRPLRGEGGSIFDVDYRRDGFDRANGYVAHFDDPSKLGPDGSQLPTKIPRLQTAIKTLIAEFAQHCYQRSARCVFTFPPHPTDPRVFNPADAAEILQFLQTVPHLEILDRPEEQLQPWASFYDTKYHLTRDGALRRTRLVVDRLRP